MPKKACCCSKSCCAPYNYTNNVAMLGDLLVEKEFLLDETGNLIRDEVTGEFKTYKDVQVYPIHPDDELILFQLPGPANIYGGPAVYQTVRDHGCACCYGRTIQRPLRTEPVRQKYKNIGCSWTWYPPKFAINGDPNIPQCSLFSEGFEYSNCYFNFTDPQLNMGASETPDMLPRKCQSCTQVHPWVADAHDIDFDIWGDPQSPLIQVPGGPTDEGITNRAQFSEYGWMTQLDRKSVV